MSPDAYVGTVWVDSVSSDFQQNPQALTIDFADITDTYEINFVDSIGDASMDSDVAEIAFFTATTRSREYGRTFELEPE